MNNEEINSLPSAFCSTTINRNYKKLLSKTIVIDDELKNIIDIEFTVEYPKDNFTIFPIRLIFKENNFKYEIGYDSDDDGIVNIIIYNSGDIRYNSMITNNMKKIISIADKNFYIKPRIIKYSNDIKEVTIELYSD